jgi:hypothetical protein
MIPFLFPTPTIERVVMVMDDRRNHAAVVVTVTEEGITIV